MNGSTPHQEPHTTATEQIGSENQRNDTDNDRNVPVPSESENDPWFVKDEVGDIVREEVRKLIEIRAVRWTSIEDI